MRRLIRVEKVVLGGLSDLQRVKWAGWGSPSFRKEKEWEWNDARREGKRQYGAPETPTLMHSKLHFTRRHSCVGSLHGEEDAPR